MVAVGTAGWILIGTAVLINWVALAFWTARVASRKGQLHWLCNLQPVLLPVRAHHGLRREGPSRPLRNP